MMALKSDAHLQVLLLRFFGCGQHAPNPRRIGRHRLLHEHMFALPHCFFKMQWPKAGRGRQDCHIRQRDRLFIAVEIGELMVGRHVHFLGVFRLQAV